MQTLNPKLAGRASTRLQPACAARVCGPLKHWVVWARARTTNTAGVSPFDLSKPQRCRPAL